MIGQVVGDPTEHTRSADGILSDLHDFKKDIQCWIVFSCMP